MLKLYDKTFSSLLGEGEIKLVTEALVEEERNGLFELSFIMLNTDSLFKFIEKENIVVCNANDTLLNQKFRIYNTRKLMSNRVEVFARHISFDLMYDYIESLSFENQSCEYALNQLFRNSNFSTNYRGYSDIVNAQNYNISNVNILEAIGGAKGSIIDTFGNGAELLRDNETIHVLNRRGHDNSVTIEYRKNLTGFELEEDTTDLVTRILPFAKYTPEGEEETIVKANYVDSPLINNYSHPYIKLIDYSDKFEDNEVPTIEKLIQFAEKEYTVNKVDIPKQNYKITFIPLSKCVGYEGLEDKISLCDTVTIIDTRYNVNTQSKVIKTVFNVLKNRYESIELGEARTSLGDIISNGSNDKVTEEEVKDIVSSTPSTNYPNTLPAIPMLESFVYGFANIELRWTFENKVFYAYEVYASKTKDFTPNTFDLIYQGQASSYMFQAQPNETWYFKVCGINSYNRRTEFSNQIEVNTVKISDLSNYVSEMAIGDALIGTLNLGRGWIGQLDANLLNVKGNFSVTDGNGKRTMDIDSFGNVNLDVNSFKLQGNSIYTSVEVDASRYYDITKGGYINVDFISNFTNGTIDIQKKYNKPNYNSTYCKYSSNYSLQKSVTAPLVSVIQSFYLQKDKDIIYFTQLQIGGRELGNLKLYKYKYSTWTYQSEMTLNEFGHGQAFSVETRSDGDYIWIECDASSAGYGRKICCFKYSAGTTYTRTTGTEYVLQEGHTANSVSIDYKNNIFCLYSRSNNATIHNYTIFDFASVKNGNPVMLGYFQLPRKTGDPDHQGFDICNKYIYVAEGTSYDTSPASNHYIKIYDYQGNLIKNYVQKMGSDYANREPEGIQIIENDAQNYELWTNIINGPSGARIQNFYKLTYTEPDIEVTPKFVHPKGSSIDIDSNPIKIPNLFSRGYLLYIDNPKLNGLSIASSYNQHLIVATVSGNAWKYENTVFYPSNNDCIIGEILVKDDKYTIANIANSYGSVFEMLTDGGNLQGIWLENGKLYINAEQLRGQTLEGVNVSTLPNYSRWGTRCKMEYDHFGIYRGNQLIAQMGMNYDPNYPLDMKKSRAFLEVGGEFDIDKDGPDSLVITKFIETDDHYATIRNFAGDGTTTSKIVTAIDFYDSGKLDFLAMKNLRFYTGDTFKFIGALGLSQNLEDAANTSPGDDYRTLQMGNNAMVFVSNNAGNWTFKRWNGSYSALYAESFNVKTTTLATTEAMALGLNSIVENNEVTVEDIIENNVVTRNISGTKLEPIPFTNIENEIENRIYKEDDSGNICNNQTEMIYVLWEAVQKLTNDIKDLQTKISELEKEGV